MASEVAVEDLDGPVFNENDEARTIFADGVFAILAVDLDVQEVADVQAQVERRLDEGSSLTIVQFSVTILSAEPASDLLETLRAVLLTATTTGELAVVVSAIDATLNVAASTETIEAGTAVIEDPDPVCDLEAPQMTLIAYEDRGVTVQVFFTAPIDVPDGDCTALFDYECTFTSSGDRVDINEFIPVGTPLTLKAGVLTQCDCDECVVNEEQTLPVAGPSNLDVVVSLQAPETASLCGDLVIDASTSTGSAGREFSVVNWFDDDASGLILTVPVEELVLGRREFTLELTNVFGSVGQATVAVEVVAEAVPLLEIIGGASRRIVLRPETTIVRVRAASVAVPKFSILKLTSAQVRKL